ncbi:MAG: FAD-dependent oxidoreductase [Deltaproteobacteria bacterium]|nr:FAD-dependent oxidoreductase [Deltaproteobacteria bacterium]
MANVLELNIDPDDIDDRDKLERRLAHALRVSVDDLPSYRVRRRSIDARRQHVRWRVLVEIEPELTPPLALPCAVSSHPVVIVGGGPAGLFCAYELARHGIGSTVIDRGKQVQPRRRDIALLQRQGEVDPESNYCFGEGGAGTFSDGKLYTRAHKRGDVSDILRVLVHHGAPPDIMIDARPHIGSNKLPKVITSIRASLEACGVAFRFSTKAVNFTVERATGQLAALELADGQGLTGDAFVLATGHSARDVWDWLSAGGVALEAKSFAIGARIEHGQSWLNRCQYGAAATHPKLPAASYRLTHSEAGVGVFSFCMCPGGWIVPSTTERDAVVVNGMSLSRRDSPFANSGIVVSIDPGRLEQPDLFAGVRYQAQIEQLAAAAGGGQQRAPAVRVKDFVEGKASGALPKSSYVPGIAPADLASVLDGGGLDLSTPLRSALRVFERRLPGFVSNEAILVGVESRTSAPIRIVRDAQTLASVSHINLYPCGEGAGYAGGIMSAALDGQRVARAIVAKLGVA